MTDSRQLILKDAPFEGSAVVYVMSRDQRAHDNHALLAAQTYALTHRVPLYVLFVLRHVPTRSREHYAFMLAGLETLGHELEKYSIAFVLRNGDAHTEILRLAGDISAGAIFFDFSPLTQARTLAADITRDFRGRVTVVDTHNIVPAWVASPKQEFAAHTMRRKIHALLEQYLVAPPPLKVHPYTGRGVDTISITQARAAIATIPASGIHITVAPGEDAAHLHLRSFIRDGLDDYAAARNDIAHDHQSGLSPYLHFGHISSLRVALEVMAHVDRPPLLMRRAQLISTGDRHGRTESMDALFEEMIVRKELSDNFCLYNEHYLSLDGTANWAHQSIDAHRDDPRDFLYTRTSWEAAATHDVAWNAAQTQLVRTGKMHGYMRMYWAKKLLEWSATPEEALQTGIYLNDKYSLDGGDPNGYVGLLWSIAGLHDRPWRERPVYGTIRYMNEAGLRRKFDLQAYIDQWS